MREGRGGEGRGGELNRMEWSGVDEWMDGWRRWEVMKNMTLRGR